MADNPAHQAFSSSKPLHEQASTSKLHLIRLPGTFYERSNKVYSTRVPHQGSRPENPTQIHCRWKVHRQIRAAANKCFGFVNRFRYICVGLVSLTLMLYLPVHSIYPLEVTYSLLHPLPVDHSASRIHKARSKVLVVCTLCYVLRSNGWVPLLHISKPVSKRVPKYYQ